MIFKKKFWRKLSFTTAIPYTNCLDKHTFLERIVCWSVLDYRIINQYTAHTHNTYQKMPSPSKIIELQKLFQHSAKPLWMRHPKSPYYLYPFWGLFAVALVSPLLYIPNAIMGVKAKKN